MTQTGAQIESDIQDGTLNQDYLINVYSNLGVGILDELDIDDESKDKKKGAAEKGIDIPKGSDSDDSVKMYLREIGMIKLLSSEEEIDLAKKVENGCEVFALAMRMAYF